MRIGVARHLDRARDIESRIGDAHRRTGDRGADETMRMKRKKRVSHLKLAGAAEAPWEGPTALRPVTPIMPKAGGDVIHAQSSFRPAPSPPVAAAGRKAAEASGYPMNEIAIFYD
jgi:hypothetical protein